MTVAEANKIRSDYYNTTIAEERSDDPTGWLSELISFIERKGFSFVGYKGEEQLEKLGPQGEAIYYMWVFKRGVEGIILGKASVIETENGYAHFIIYFPQGDVQPPLARQKTSTKLSELLTTVSEWIR